MKQNDYMIFMLKVWIEESESLVSSENEKILLAALENGGDGRLELDAIYRSLVVINPRILGKSLYDTFEFYFNRGESFTDRHRTTDLDLDVDLDLCFCGAFESFGKWLVDGFEKELTDPDETIDFITDRFFNI